MSFFSSTICGDGIRLGRRIWTPNLLIDEIYYIHDQKFSELKTTQ